MFSQTTEYALRATTILATLEKDTTFTTAEVAQYTKVPAGYLSKVLQTLTKAGLVVAVRGLKGGYRLSRAPELISVLEVVNAVEPLGRIRECPLGLPYHQALCPLHRQIDDAVAQVEQQLAQHNLKEMVDPYFVKLTLGTAGQLVENRLGQVKTPQQEL